MTQFCSTERDGRTIPSESDTGPVMLTINHVTYDVEIYFYKDGQDEDEWAFLKHEFINSIEFNEDLFDPFPVVTLTYGGSNIKDPIPFEGNANDRVYIFLSKVKTEHPRDGEPKTPYPLIDCEFVIWRMNRSPNENVNQQNQTSTTQLVLIPYVHYKLLTTYPQWTTGFDRGFSFGKINLSNIFNAGSGKLTGACIKEILKKCDCEVDTGNNLFDDGIGKINYTIPLRQSALAAIEHILQFHLSQQKDVCVFKYNQFSKKFVLPSFSQLFKHDLTNDEIKTYLTIPIRSEYTKNIDNQNIMKITSPVCSNIVHSIETIGTESIQTVRTSRRKGTFVIDSQECDKKAYEDYIKNNYKDGLMASEQDDILIAPYQRIMTNVLMTPHYRGSERIGMSPQLSNKIKTSNTFAFTMPGTGGTIQVGRRFQVCTGYGAAKDNEKLKEMLGAYIISHVTHLIVPRKNSYVVRTTGKSLFQAKDERFAFTFVDDEAQDMAEQNAKANSTTLLA